MRKKSPPPRSLDSLPFKRFAKLFNLPRPLRKWMCCQLFGFLVVAGLWIYYNRGIVPSFMRTDESDIKADPKCNILLYYSESNNDASRITWARGVNSQMGLQSALQGNVHIIEADVSLKGQGTKRQQLVPIMGQPSDTNEELTFERWAEQIVSSTKAIKLHFHSTESVEISLDTLKTKLKGNRRPIWLHADVLKGPHSTDEEIDGTRFLRAVDRYFPDATISLGWTTGSHTDYSQSGYTWSAVMDMYNFLKHHNIIHKQPLTISVRLSLMENSVLQLKWLCDNTDASLTVFHSSDDIPTHKNVMYASFKFAPDKSFFDLNHAELENYLKSYRHFSKDRLNPLVLERDMVAFRPKAWLKVGFHKQIEAILPSEDAAILLTPDVHLLTKSKYEPNEKIRLYGRVMFLNRKSIPALRTSGLQIFFRTDQISHPDELIGIRVLVGVKGNVDVESVGIVEKPFHQSTHLTPSSMTCYRFGIVNGEKEMVVHVSSLSNCETLAMFHEKNTVHAELKVPIPKFTPLSARPIAIKVADRSRAAVIDQLIVEYAADGHFSHPI